MTKRIQKKSLNTMSTQQAPAPNMTETSVIKHYKKQLIYRQHDVPEPDDKHSPQFLNEVSNTKIYDLVESEKNNKNKNDTNNGKKVRRKRKNKNCRGQFRHEAMELIKLGANPSHSLCKTKESLNARTEKPLPSDDRNVPQSKAEPIKEPPNQSVIHTNYVNKTILENPAPKLPQYGHALPQMVPERRNSREYHHPKVPVIYRSPPHRPALPEYCIPYPPHYTHSSMPFRLPPALPPPPPPYPVARSPPRPVPRTPIRPIPQPAFPKNVPYSGIHFPYSRQSEYTNGYHFGDFPERKKRKHEEKVESHPVVAAIDLTVDQNSYKKKKASKHECHCECGKTYTSDPVTQEVIITVKDRDSCQVSQVPSTYISGKMVNGTLQLDQKVEKSKPLANGIAKSIPPVPTKGQTTETKLPQLFLIEDLLSKKRISSGEVRKEEKISHVPIRPESNRVIVSAKALEEPKPKPKDYTVRTIIGSDNRRQSVDIDTISISSSSSESVRSPRPKSNGSEKQIPHGKLYYYKVNNSFIRYFDDTQKKLFYDSIASDGQTYDKNTEEKEVIELPQSANFSSKDNLTVEEYVSEMTLVEKFIPRDFFLFYKFVTGYQICNNNLPVSFLTFLKVYNTNGLKILLERYINSLKQN